MSLLTELIQYLLTQPQYLLAGATRPAIKMTQSGGKMSDCALISSCRFFNDKMAHMPSTADMMKRKYCRGENSNCARFIVFEALGKEGVPADLTPNETEKARQLTG
jgi:hypothetical protein